MYARAPHVREMLTIVERIYAMSTSNVAALNIAAIEDIANYFELTCEFRRSSDMVVSGKSTERLLAITKQLSGSVYITGHGARNYLEHELFEKSSVRVEYMKYNQTEYKQLLVTLHPFRIDTGFDRERRER